MSTDRKHIDDLLRDKFLSFEGDIPMSDWDAIEERLNRKKRIAWIWWAAIPLLLIAGLGILTLINSKHSTNSDNKEQIKNKAAEQVIINAPSSNSGSTNNTIEEEISDKNNNSTDYKLEQMDLNKTTKNPSTGSSDKNNISNQPEVKDNNNFDILYITGKSVPNLWNTKLSFVEKAKELQLERPKTKGPDKTCKFSYEFGINISPAIGLDAIKNNKLKSKFIHDAYYSSIAGSSSLGSGFNNGLNIQVNIGKKWYLRSGIYTTNYSVQRDYNYRIDSLPIVDETHGIKTYYRLPFSETIKYSGESMVKFVSIPLLIGNRSYLTNKWGVESKIGLNISRLMSSSGKTANPTTLYLEDVNRNNSIRKWTTGLTISTGVFYKPNNKLIFTVEPNFTTLLGSAFNKNYPVKNRYYNYGLNINVNYILKGGKKG